MRFRERKIKRVRVIATLLCSLLAGLDLVSTHASSTEWTERSFGITEPQINCIAVHPNSPQMIFVGTPQALYRSNNQGESFQLFFKTQSSHPTINAIVFDEAQPSTIMVATDSGVFISEDKGQTWQSIYQPKDANSRRCLAVIKIDKDFYIATAVGLFYRRGKSSTWHKASGILGQQSINHLVKDSTYLYISTTNELYRWKIESSIKGKKNKETFSVEEIFHLGGRGESVAIEENTREANEAMEATDQIKDLALGYGGNGAQMPNAIYLATDKGIIYSQDHGKTWQSMPSDGLPNEHVTSLTVLPNQEIFVATQKGVYLFKENHWESIYQGIPTLKIFDVTHDGRSYVYAGTDHGVFALKRESASLQESEQKNEALNTAAAIDSQPDPTIREVQQWAIDYAEVHPNKIREWRRAAKLKAILPTVSAGYDRNGTELYHWDSGANPDELLKGKTYSDWDISVSWDLGELIWNNDQTSIDTRSKLMVELREDVLDQVTRLYFERRRIQMDLAMPDEMDTKKLAEKKMRLEELSAHLDALTGGEFSCRIEERAQVLSQNH
ncbi:MAG: YCF48-related protein [Candidatus Omnitrophica bacterium]|nr:YCF48-related protein [Candidatus Omnitrophota bacterium]